jgi:hypothetical protein
VVVAGLTGAGGCTNLRKKKKKNPTKSPTTERAKREERAERK